MEYFCERVRYYTFKYIYTKFYLVYTGCNAERDRSFKIRRFARSEIREKSINLYEIIGENKF